MYPTWCVTDVDVTTFICWLIMVLVTLFNIIFNAVSIKKLCKLYSQPYTFATLHIAINILFMISSCTYTIHIGQSIFCSTRMLWTIIGLTGSCGYIIGLDSLYLLYVCRLQSIFHATRFSLSVWLLLFFLSGFVLQIIGAILLLYYFTKDGENIDWEKSVMSYVAFIIINFVFNLFLLTIFMRKIYILTRLAMNTANKKHVNVKLEALLYPAIRYIICAFISMLSSNILSILGYLRSNYAIFGTMDFYALHIMLILVDQSVNSIFLFLQYSFSDKVYKKYFSKLHWCLHKTIAHKINNECNKEIEASRAGTTSELTTNTTDDKIYEDTKTDETKATITTLSATI